MKKIACLWLAALIAGSPTFARQGANLVFKNETAAIRVGLDNRVYASSGTLFLRTNRDGSHPVGAPAGASVANATAGPQGIIAAAYAHFAKNVTLFDAEHNVLGRFSRIADAGFRSPAEVAAGPSGDFYALDQGRDQILRFHADGIRSGLYRIPREPPGPAGELVHFRVCEKTKTLYVLNRAPLIRCFRFSESEWKMTCEKLWETRIEGSLDAGSELSWGYGGFDVDEEGVLYVVRKTGEVVQSYDPQGKPLQEIRPAWGELKPTPQDFANGLAVSQGEIFIHRHHPTELFQRYHLASGKRLGVAAVPENYSAILSAPKSRDLGRPTPAVASGIGIPPGRDKPIRVLFIGNSQVNCVSDIPDIVEELSRSRTGKGPLLLAEEVVVGGVGLEGYWNDGLARMRIAAGGWDWVVTNEIVYSYGGHTAKFREFARKFNSEAKKVGARMLFFATGEVEKAKLKTEAMYQDALTEARECGGRAAGGGAAWRRAWEKQPTLDLHHTDRAHPNARGYYLNACVIYSALTGESPVGLDPCGLGKDEAKFFQEIAWEQAKDDRVAETK